MVHNAWFLVYHTGLLDCRSKPKPKNKELNLTKGGPTVYMTILLLPPYCRTTHSGGLVLNAWILSS